MSASTLTREQALEIYYFLRLNRSLEEQLARLFRQNKIFGGLYGSLGQEAISVGTAYALGPGDWMAPMIRNIGALLVRGFKPRDILTQHMARYTSPTQGKDGTSHFGDLKVRHVVSPISMLGDLIPVMTGVAMAGRYLGQKIVAMTWIGDGGTSTGAFHEGLNLAAVQKAPFVLIVENNQWAYSTPVSSSAAARSGRPRRAYGIASAIVDGNDVGGGVAHDARSGRASARRRGPGADRSQDHAHARPRAARCRGIRAARNVRVVESARPARLATRNISPRTSCGTRRRRRKSTRASSAKFGEDLEFAENSPFPPPELAEQGVYCDGCHTVEAEWQRPKEEVMPPRSSVKAEWPRISAAMARGRRPRRRRAESQAPEKPARATVRAKAGR